MAKTSTLSINALEKQCSILEAKIIRAKSKKITQLEKAITKNKSDTVKLKTKLTVEKTKLRLAKTSAKKKTSKQKQNSLRKTITDKNAELDVLKAVVREAKIDYKNTVSLQKAKAAITKIVINAKGKKRVLGLKVNAKKVDKRTVVPASFLNIDTHMPVEPRAPESK